MSDLNTHESKAKENKKHLIRPKKPKGPHERPDPYEDIASAEHVGTPRQKNTKTNTLRKKDI